MPDQVHLIPLAEIDAAALPRDRTGLDPEPQAELVRAIAASGLRQPVELFPLPEPRGPLRYGLLSGYRRLHAFLTLHADTADARWTTIPAFLRPASSHATALAAMIEENEIRANITPFERGRIAVIARNQGAFASIEEAVDGLYPNAAAYKRSRLRSLAYFAEEMDGQLTAPEKITQSQAFRIARALSAGFGELIRTALEESSITDAEHQWELLLPILAEAEANGIKPETSPHAGRPRRILRPRYALTIWRERTRDGWSLHFTGREATGPMIDVVLDDIERMYSPA